MAHFAHRVSGSYIRLGRLDPFGRQPELGLLGRRHRSRDSRLRCRRPRSPNSVWRPNATEAGVGARNPVGEITEMGHLRRLGGRWSALGGAWPDPKGPGRCLPTPWVPWVRAVPIGPLRWPGGRSWTPEPAIWRPQRGPCVAEICPCPGAVRPTHTPEAGVCGPCTPGVSY